MKEEPSLPLTPAECADEVAALGLRLIRVPGELRKMVLVQPQAGYDELIESFQNELWTELECAQAAVRFARYFMASQDGVPPKNDRN